jgi:hypothetical protein
VSEPDLLAALLPVLRALEELEVPHYIGGSLASSAHGVPRASIDADVIAALQPRHADSLIAALSDAYYLSEERLREAIARRSSSNVIHLDTMIKIDIFVAKDRAVDRRALERRERATIGGGYPALPIASAEDIVLAKLEWYRLGGEISTRQWEDVAGVLRTNRGTLDVAYLRTGAAELGVSELLLRALEEAAALE